MWLVFSPVPELVRGRRVVCHSNLYGGGGNMGTIYVDEDGVVVDGDLVTARTQAATAICSPTLLLIGWVE